MAQNQENIETRMDELRNRLAQTVGQLSNAQYWFFRDVRLTWIDLCGPEYQDIYTSGGTKNSLGNEHNVRIQWINDEDPHWLVNLRPIEFLPPIPYYFGPNNGARLFVRRLQEGWIINRIARANYEMRAKAINNEDASVQPQNIMRTEEEGQPVEGMFIFLTDTFQVERNNALLEAADGQLGQTLEQTQNDLNQINNEFDEIRNLLIAGQQLNPMTEHQLKNLREEFHEGVSLLHEMQGTIDMIREQMPHAVNLNYTKGKKLI